MPRGVTMYLSSTARETVVTWERVARTIRSFRLESDATLRTVSSTGAVEVAYASRIVRAISADGSQYDRINESRPRSGYDRDLLITNDAYSARAVERKPGAGWVLAEEVVIPPRGGWKQGLPGGGIGRPSSLLPWLWVNGNTSLHQLLGSPRLRPTAVEPLSAGGRRLHFVMDPSVSPPPDRPLQPFALDIRSGQFDIGPGEAAPLTGFHFRFEHAASGKQKAHSDELVATFEYEQDSSGVLPRLRKAIFDTPPHTDGRGERLNYKEEVTYSVRYDESIDPRTFYLSHYGLPEPPGITPPSRPTPTYVWLLIAAGGFGVITLACRWLLKRRAKVALPPPVSPTA